MTDSVPEDSSFVRQWLEGAKAAGHLDPSILASILSSLKDEALDEEMLLNAIKECAKGEFS